MKSHIIWTNEINKEDWTDLLAEHPEATTEEEQLRLIDEENAENLNCERVNLSIDVGTEILAIARLGLWNGQHTGYMEMHSCNLADCFNVTCGDYVTWYLDELGDFCCEDIHHDGTNTYTFRAWRPGISRTQKHNFLYKIYYGKITRADIARYTRSLGPEIANVYGWKLKGGKPA